MTVLAETVVLLQEANKELDPLSPVTLEVNAEKNGSFVSYRHVRGIGEGSLFPKEAFETAVLTISTVLSLLELWRKLRKLTPKSHSFEGNKVVIETVEGNASKQIAQLSIWLCRTIARVVLFGEPLKSSNPIIQLKSSPLLTKRKNYFDCFSG